MYEHSPILKLVMDNAETFPNKKAIIINGEVITYGNLSKNVKKAASVLIDSGVIIGDRIVLSAHKDIEYIYLYFASHMIGAINVIVDSESNNERLRYIERTVQPKYCFGYISPEFPSITFDKLDIDIKEEYDESKDGLSEDDIAEILFTTGTTGLPKGVCLSYMNIFSSASNINEFIKNNSDDVELLGLPICHSFGLGRIRCTLIKGATIVIQTNFANVRSCLRTIEQYKVTGFSVVPTAWAYIRKMSGTRIAKYSSQIKYIEIGSAAMSLSTKKEMLELFPHTRICMHYGLTEASRSCFVEFHDKEHIDSIGKPVSDKVDVKILDKNGKEVTHGEKGEICVKGKHVFTRYLDESDTQDAFYGEYFRTGDCGYKTADGYLYLFGREKELINVGGKKVSPMEVEETIISIGVGDCICVPMKDDKGIMGEVVFCYILKDSTSLGFEEIAERLIPMLEPYKRPVAYEWIEKIPMTASGKKQRVQIKK